MRHGKSKLKSESGFGRIGLKRREQVVRRGKGLGPIFSARDRWNEKEHERENKNEMSIELVIHDPSYLIDREGPQKWPSSFDDDHRDLVEEL